MHLNFFFFFSFCTDIGLSHNNYIQVKTLAPFSSISTLICDIVIDNWLIHVVIYDVGVSNILNFTLLKITDFR